jgi:hypothetical protein
LAFAKINQHAKTGSLSLKRPFLSHFMKSFHDSIKMRNGLKRENYWLDLISGVRVHVRPASTALVMAARVEALKEDAEPALRSTALIKRLAQLAILEWDGVGGEDGEALPVTPEGIYALMDLWPIAEAFERLYLGPALLLEQEKND